MDWDLSCSLTVLQMEPAAGMEPSVTRVDVDSPRDGTSVLSVVADSTIPRQAIEPLGDSMQAHDAIDAAPAIIETAAKPVEVDAAEPSGGLESAIHGVVAGSPKASAVRCGRTDSQTVLLHAARAISETEARYMISSQRHLSK